MASCFLPSRSKSEDDDSFDEYDSDRNAPSCTSSSSFSGCFVFGGRGSAKAATLAANDAETTKTKYRPYGTALLNPGMSQEPATPRGRAMAQEASARSWGHARSRYHPQGAVARGGNNGAQAAGLSPSCSNGGTVKVTACPSFTLGEMLKF